MMVKKGLKGGRRGGSELGTSSVSVVVPSSVRAEGSRALRRSDNGDGSREEGRDGADFERLGEVGAAEAG